MAFPTHADYLIIGAGIHGLSTAWRLAERLIANGEDCRRTYNCFR